MPANKGELANAIQAVRQAAPTTPIISGTDDLVSEGHAASLNRPGGNVTGISIMASELNAKRLEVLKEAMPSASRVLVLWDPATGTFHLPLLGSVAQALDTQLQVHEVRRREDLDPVFEMAQSWRAEAVNVLASPLLHALREPIIAQAAVHRLPAIYQWEESARAGGLMSYGPIRRDVYQAISRQLARVLKALFRPSSPSSSRPNSSWSSTSRPPKRSPCKSRRHCSRAPTR